MPPFIYKEVYSFKLYLAVKLLYFLRVPTRGLSDTKLKVQPNIILKYISSNY